MKKIVKESYEVPGELQAKLNSILADEFLAAEAYRIAEYAMAGNKQHILEEVAEANGKDELDDHFKNLCEWMQSKGINVVTSHKEMEQITNCTPIEIDDGESTVSILEKLILSEEEAIDVYETIIPETKLDLKVMLAGFLKDEREHLKALADIRSELSGGRTDVTTPFKDDLYEESGSPLLDPYFSDDFDVESLDISDQEDLLNAVYKELDDIEDMYKKKRFGRKQSRASFMNDVEDYKVKRDILERNRERLEMLFDIVGNDGEGFQP